MTNLSNITRTPAPNATVTPSVYNTSNASGEVAARVGPEQVPVIVEQGPAWLARLAYAPPPWLDTLLAVLVVGVLGLAALGYYRHGIDEQVLGEMAQAALTIVCVLLVASVVRSWALPYVAKALGAGVGGWLVATGFARSVRRVTESDQEAPS